jgi:hypothetical protein
MPWTVGWFLMALAQAGGAQAGAPPGFVEGDTCVLAAPLQASDGPTAAPRLLPEGSEVRIVRPQAGRTDVLVEGVLVGVATEALAAACRSVAHGGGAPGGSATGALAQAEERFAQLRFADVVPLLRGVLVDDSITVEQRARAYYLLGSSYAVMGYTIESETAFRSLLRLQPAFRLDAGMSPKIASVFERVARENEALERQEAAARRAEMLAELKLTVPELDQLPGGEPVRFDIGVRDPRGVVDQARVFYRRRGQPAFASLALVRDAGGRWLGELPAAFTASQRGFVLEFYVATFDEGDGELVSMGSEGQPIDAQVLAGQLPSAPVYQSAWFWVVVGGAAGAATLVALGASVGAVAYGASAAFPGIWVFSD